MVRARVGVADRGRQIVGNLPFVPHRDVERPRVLEIAVHDVYGWLERRPGGEREQAVKSRWRQESNRRARAEQRLAERAVGAPDARQVQWWNTGLIEAGVEADYLLPVGVRVPGDLHHRLRHLLV